MFALIRVQVCHAEDLAGVVHATFLDNFFCDWDSGVNLVGTIQIIAGYMLLSVWPHGGINVEQFLQCHAWFPGIVAGTITTFEFFRYLGSCAGQRFPFTFVLVLIWLRFIDTWLRAISSKIRSLTNGLFFRRSERDYPIPPEAPNKATLALLWAKALKLSCARRSSGQERHWPESIGTSWQQVTPMNSLLFIY